MVVLWCVSQLLSAQDRVENGSACFVFTNKHCLLNLILQGVHKKMWSMHGISFLRSKNLSLISGNCVWERDFQKTEWRSWPHIYSPIMLLFSLTIFDVKLIKVMTYITLHLNLSFLTQKYEHLGYIQYHVNCVNYILPCEQLWILLRICHIF